MALDPTEEQPEIAAANANAKGHRITRHRVSETIDAEVYRVSAVRARA